MRLITRLIHLIKRKPPNTIEKAIKDNKNIEHAFIKYPKKEIQETTENATKYFTSHSPKIIEEYRKRLKENIKNYNPKREKYIHTHLDLAIPSYRDIMHLIGSSIRNESDYSHIYVHNKKGKVIGKTTATIDYKKLLENKVFLKDISNIMVQVKKTEVKYVENELINNIFTKYRNIYKTQKKKDNNLENIVSFYEWLGIKVRTSPIKGYKFNYEKMIFEKK